MKRIILVLLAALACSLTVRAQTSLPVQTKVVGPLSYPAPSAVYNEILKPTGTGNTLVVVLSPSGNPILSDSQNNIWTNTCGSLWTAPTAGGPDTITVTYSSVNYTAMLIAEYSNKWVLDACAPLAFGTGTTATSNGLSASAGDLLIGYGWNGTSNYVSAAANPPFQLEGFSNIFLADEAQSAAGAASSTMVWGGSVGWVQGLVALKLLVPPPPPIQNIVTVNISATYDDGSIPTILTVNVNDTTNPKNTLGQLSLTPDPVTGAASGVFTLVNTETYQVALLVAGSQVGQTFYDGGLVLALMPQLSQANFSIVLFKATGAVKSFTSGAQ